MKALLVNPKSPRSFWTLDQSLKLVGKKTVLPPLGLLTVAALLPKEWELRLVDRSFQKLDAAVWDWADIILLTGMIVHREDMLHVIGEAKVKGKPVVVGGPCASSLPDEFVEAGADYVVLGEAETSLEPFLAALADGRVSGVFPAQPRPDMTTSPLPRFDLLDMDAYIDMSIQTSRGCPFECEFCDIINLYGRSPRYKSPEQVIAELECLNSLGWRGEVFICDDNFIGSKKHARGILAKLTPWLEANGKPFAFMTQTSLNLGHDPELIDRITEANFGNVFIGIESPDDEVLKLTHKYQNTKNPLEEAIHNICANGLTVVGSFVLGFDGEIKGVDQRIIALVEKTNMPAPMINLLQAAPNTALWDRLISENRLLSERTNGQTTGGNRLNFVPSRPESEIIQEYVSLTETLYEPSAFMKRAYNYYLTMRPTRAALGSKAGKAPNKMPPRAKVPTRFKLRQTMGFMAIVWRRGIVSPHRYQWWKQLLGIYRKNPSRMMGYLMALGFGENLIHMREMIRKRGRPEDRLAK
ncbi:B12-binding domain-containing radical SAM protein [Thermodesulfobacteriota bacterium]